MRAESPRPDVSGVDAQLSEFKRLQPAMGDDGSAVLTLLDRAGERFYFRLPSDQIVALAAAADRHLGRSAAAAFPLDAEQTIRLCASGLALLHNVLRQRDEKPALSDNILLGLADDLGIPVPTRSNQYGDRWPLPYGSTSVAEEDLSPSERRSRSLRPGSGTPGSPKPDAPGRGEVDV